MIGEGRPFLRENLTASDTHPPLAKRRFLIYFRS